MKQAEKKITIAVNAIMTMYGEIQVLPLDEFEKAVKSQGYRDSLEAMKRAELISDYNLQDRTIKL